jgi:hypothetical protein
MRRTATAVVTVIVFACAAALGLPAGATARDTDPHEVSAEQEAATIMAAYPAAVTWQEVSTAPTPDLATLNVGIGPGSPVQQTRFWVVPSPIASVIKTVSVPPTGFSGEANDLGSSGGTAVFGGPQSVAWGAFLLVSVASIDSTHTGVRVDAEVIWYPTRLADELAPSGLTSATVTAWISGTDRVMSRRTFTDAATIRKLAYQFDVLQVEPIGGYRGCPLPPPLRIGLRLSGPGSHSIVANAGVGCGLVGVAADNHALPYLMGVRNTGGPSLEDIEASTLRTTTDALLSVAIALTYPHG